MNKSKRRARKGNRDIGVAVEAGLVLRAGVGCAEEQSGILLLAEWVEGWEGPETLFQVSTDGQEVAGASGWADAGTGRQRRDLLPLVRVWGEVNMMVGPRAQRDVARGELGPVSVLR